MIHPVYYRHIYKDGLHKFVKFAENVWSVEKDGKSDEVIALEGINALADFIKELGLPTSLKELGVQSREQLRAIADSCGISQGGYRQLTHDEIYELFCECYE